ncbi:MAG: hypothetical protein ACKOAS_05170 [Verrucomicrobiota bacterium]|jgi:hypothetical protein
MDNDSISKLLRLKRYEKPPEGYFEDFLSEFQLRQRAEVIHRPFFRIAWDRLCSLLTPPPVPRLVLAGSFAAAVIASGLVLNWADNDTEANIPPMSMTLSRNEPIQIDASRPTEPSAKPASSIEYVLPAQVVSYASRRSF